MARKAAPAPKSLRTKGREKWSELAPHLRDRSQFSLDQLEIYCRAYERWYDSQAWLDQHTDVVVLQNEEGRVTRAMISPRLQIAQQMEKAMQEASKYLHNKVVT